MLKFILLIFLFSLSNQVYANNKNQIINKLENISNLNFDFEQNINGKIELGNCTIQYPKKMFCEYDKKNKVMVSNGKSLVIKSNLSYYRYALNKTPLNFILDKNFLLKKISELNEEIINNSLVKFTIKENNQLISGKRGKKLTTHSNKHAEFNKTNSNSPKKMNYNRVNVISKRKIHKINYIVPC